MLLMISNFFAPTATAGMQIVRLCNEGTVDIAMASAREQRAFLAMGQLWETEGWEWVAPGDCSNVYVSATESNTVLNIVFGVSSPAGVFGVIDHPLNVRQIPNRQEQVCVSPDRFSYSSNPTPPCESGFKAAPTSSALWISGAVDWRLRVEPTAADFERMTTVLSAPAGTPEAAALPPQKTWFGEEFQEIMRRIEQEAAAALPELAETCSRAADGEDTRYCQCKAQGLIQGADVDERAPFLSSWSHQDFMALRRQRPGIDSKFQTCAAESGLPPPAPLAAAELPKPVLPVQPASMAPSADVIAARGEYLLECFALVQATVHGRGLSDQRAWWSLGNEYLIAAGFHAEAVGQFRYAPDGREARVYPYFDRLVARIEQGSPPTKSELDACLAFQPPEPFWFQITELRRDRGTGLNFGDDKQAQLRYDLDLWWNQKASNSMRPTIEPPMTDEHMRYGLQQWVSMGRLGTTPGE